MNRTRLVFSGSGGQGVVTAAILLAEAAVLRENLFAVQTQSYGAAARGGATRADVIISDTKINYPMVNQPNILVCLTQEAYNKYAPIIRPGGLLLTDTHYVKIEHKVEARQCELPMFDRVMEKIGKTLVFNICVLGALIGLTGLTRPDAILEVLRGRLSASLVELNQQAFQLGLALGQANDRTPHKR